MATKLSDLFMGVEVVDAVQAGELQIFGVRWRPLKDADYQTLDEAMAGGVLQVTEVSDAGSVPELTVTNNGATRVLLIAGEQLVGAKQNRVLNASVMVAPRSVTKIPVSCVERGRWGYRSRMFGSSGSSSHYYLRRMMSKSVSRSYAICRSPRADQSEVWEEVDRKLDSMGSFSDSDALEQAYEDYHDRLSRMLAGVRVPEGCNGVVFAFDGRIAGMDLFDKPETLVKLLPKLAKAYGIDALEAARRRQASRQRPDAPAQAESAETGSSEAKTVDRHAVGSWLRAAAGARFQKFPSAGLGEDVRIESKEAVGAGLIVQEQPVHVELFAE